VIIPPLKAILRFLSIIVIVATAEQFFVGTSTAQQSADPRFGLVNAFRAPDSADQSGASWELLTLRWDQLQPGGPADWVAPPATDGWLSSARTAGREVVAVLIGTPGWATDGKQGTGIPRGLYLPVNDANNLWANYVRKAVSYYGVQGINRWVIWDSPDIPADTPGGQWDGTTEDYYQMVKVAYLVVKESNPNGKVHLGGISENNPTWFNRFLEVVVNDPTAAANDYYFDVATVHIFFSPEKIYTLTANPNYLMGRQGMPAKPVWINQTNARPGVEPKVYPEDTKFRQHPNITVGQQAAFIVQAYALGFAAGAERIAVYQLTDDLENDQSQAFGLVRSDSDRRPAFAAYQLAVQQMSGFVLVRRVDEEAQPLIEYVRFTFASKVVHVAWARTAQNATLLIPSRSQRATLYDLDGNQWWVKPEGELYRVVVGGADCNDPNTVGGCMIGGMPWILVEEGVANPLEEKAPSVTTQPGGALPTPDPGPFLTATALAMPTSTPTAVPTSTSVTTQAATQEQAAIVPTAPGDVTLSTASAEEAATPEPNPASIPTSAPGSSLRPQGFAAIVPYLLIGLGMMVIGGGVWFFFMGPKKPISHPPQADQTREHEPVIFAPDEEPTREWDVDTDSLSER